MARSGGGEESIQKTFEHYGAMVSKEKLTKAKQAFEFLKTLADSKKSKEKHKHAALYTDSRGLSYDDVRTHHREAGGILFDVLRSIHKSYDLPGIWQNYIFLINIYMESKEYDKRPIQSFYPSEYGGPVNIKVDHAAARADHHAKQKKEAEKHVEIDPIKYVLTIARTWDARNQTLQNDLDKAKENHEMLLESSRRLYLSNREQYECIKERHLESHEPLVQEMDEEKKAASKLFEVLKYAVNKAPKVADSEIAQSALFLFHMLVELHIASLRPVATSQSQQDLQNLSKEEVLPKILERLKINLGEKMYKNSLAELQNLQEKNDLVMASPELRIRRQRWEELSYEIKVQRLKEMEESDEFQNDVHKALCKARKENIPGYDKALEYLATLLMSETLYNSTRILHNFMIRVSESEEDGEESSLDLSASVRQKAQVLHGQKEWEYCLTRAHGQAEWKCINCGDFFCTPCKSSHKMGKKTGLHRLLHLDERDKEDAVRKEVFCRQHEERELEMYCINDKIPICILCEREPDHKGHEITTIVKYANETRYEVGSTLTEADKLIPQFENILEKVAVAEKQMNINHGEVDTVVKEVIAKIQQTAATLKEGDEKTFRRLKEKEGEVMTKKDMVWSKVLETRKYLENCSNRELITQGKDKIKELKAVIQESSPDAEETVQPLSREDIINKLKMNVF